MLINGRMGGLWEDREMGGQRTGREGKRWGIFTITLL